MSTQTAIAPQPVHDAPEAVTPRSRRAGETLRALPRATRSEWIKLSTIRSHKVIAALTLVVSAFVSWALARFAVSEAATTAEVFTFATVFVAVFAAIAGIMIYSSEVQHGTMAPTLTAQPARSLIAGSKTIVATIFGAFLGLVGLAAGILGAQVAGLPLGDVSSMITAGGQALLFSTLAAILGLGIGMIARHSTPAISGLLVWWLVVENLLTVFVNEQYSRFLPFVAGSGLLGAEQPGEPVSALALTTTQNGLVFGAYAVATLAIGMVVFSRRDNN